MNAEEATGRASAETTTGESRDPSQFRIETRGIRHVYGRETKALDGIDLEIGRGLFGLLGPNGAGKSTLMRVLCTLLVPTEGEAKVLGHDVVKERMAVRQRLGYLPQEFGSWRLQRVEEVLDTLSLLSGISDKQQRRDRVHQALADVGLEEVADRKVKKLSGGMVRRLGVAQAMIHDPDVLVVDEPTVGLDPEERIRFRQLMARLGEERIIVLSTHIVADLGAGCRRIGLLDQGRLVFDGSPTELVTRAHGQVFEMAGDGRLEEQLLSQNFEIVSRTVGKLRCVAPSEDLPEGAERVDRPTLEEAYLAFMAKRGRAEAITSEEGALESSAPEAGETP